MRTRATTVVVTGCLAASLFLASTANAQRADGPPRLPAAAGPAAEIQEMHERAAVRDPIGRIDRAYVLDALEKLEPGSTLPETLERRGNRPLSGAAQAPREARAAQQERDRPDRAGVPTRENLLREIRGMPGGPELLEEARRGGANISSNASRPDEWLAGLNPFRVREARAQSNYSVVLSPQNPVQQSPYAALTAYGAFASGTASNIPRWTLRNYRVNKNGLVTRIDGPQAFVHVNIPTTGWYVLNYRGFGGSAAQLVHEPNPGIVNSWNYAGQGTWHNYPAILHLSAGWHHLSFIVTGGHLMLTSVSIFSL